MANERLTTKEIQEYKEAFKLFDKNKDNRICMRELGKVMNILGKYPTDEELKQLIAGIDIDGNGTVEFNEFLLMMKKSLKYVNVEEDMKAMFKVFDKDGNGFISPDELRLAMNDLGERLTDRQLRDMIRAADLNGDGLIDYKEFARMIAVDKNK